MELGRARNEVTAFSGVQAVRRDVFLIYFAGLINSEVANLCIATEVSMTHVGEKFWIGYHANKLSSSPQSFRPISPIGPPAADGFTDLLSLSFVNTAHDQVDIRVLASRGLG